MPVDAQLMAGGDQNLNARLVTANCCIAWTNVNFCSDFPVWQPSLQQKIETEYDIVGEASEWNNQLE